MGGPDAHPLTTPADQMHLHARLVPVPHRAVPEGVDVKVAAELSVDPHEQVPVERRRHTERVVVCQQQLAFRLDQVDADEEVVAWVECGSNTAKERVGARPIEIADVGSEKQHERALAGLRDLSQSAFVLRLMLHDLDVVQCGQRVAGLVERFLRDVNQVEI